MLDGGTSLVRWHADRSLRRRAWVSVAVTSSSQFLYMVDSGFVALALPEIERSFDVSRDLLAWVSVAFLVAQSSFLLIAGRLGDRHGRKRFFLAGLLVFSLGAMCAAVAPTVGLLIAARSLQGIGAAFLTSGALALVLPMFPVSRAAVVIGVWGVAGAVAALMAPPLGSLIVERDWRVGFLVIVPIGLVAAAVGHRLLDDAGIERSTGQPDRVSYLIGPPALGLTMLTLSRGSIWGWTSMPTTVCALAALMMVSALLRRSFTASSPLLELDVIRNRSFGRFILAGVGQQMGFFGWYLTAPLIMRQLWGWSVREVGVALALTQLLALVGSPVAGQCVVRFGQRVPIVIGALVVAGAMAWQLGTADVEPDFWSSYLPVALALGFGSAMCGTVVTGSALSALPEHSLGAGNSIAQLTRRMGGALGVAFGITLLGEGHDTELLAGARRVWVFVLLLHLAMVVPVLQRDRPAPRDRPI